MQVERKIAPTVPAVHLSLDCLPALSGVSPRACRPSTGSTSLTRTTLRATLSLSKGRGDEGLPSAYIAGLLLFLLLACNPFAPGLDNSPLGTESLLGDPSTVEGVFQNIRYAYTFRDTSIYGQLVSSDFFFTFRDYERGLDVTWGRDEEMRITRGLFENVQRLDLVWNNVLSVSVDSTETFANVSRNFSLTVTFNQSDVLRADGYATLTLSRPVVAEAWRITRWRDDSNF